MTVILNRYLGIFGYGAIAVVLWVIALGALVAFLIAGISAQWYAAVAVLLNSGYYWNVDAPRLPWYAPWIQVLIALGTMALSVPVGFFAGTGAAEATRCFHSYRKPITNSESIAAK